MPRTHLKSFRWRQTRKGIHWRPQRKYWTAASGPRVQNQIVGVEERKNVYVERRRTVVDGEEG
jgi:hypothetical protein